MSSIWDPAGFFDEPSSSKLAREQWEWYKSNYETEYADKLDYADKYFRLQENEAQYQRYLNMLGMQREDDAVQRRVADLKAAGLSPTLAAGSAADSGAMRASSVSPSNVPNVNSVTNPQIETAMFRESMKKDYIALASSVLGNIADISRTKAEAELMKAQTDKVVGETPIDLKIKEMDQILKESTLEHEITIKAQQVDLNELKKINDELTGKVLSNEVAIKAYEAQIKSHESKIKDIEAKYAEREHKAGLSKTEAERDKLVEEVKEKAIAVQMAEFLRDKSKEAGVPFEMMSPAFKNYMSFLLHGEKSVTKDPLPGGKPFSESAAGKFFKKIFVKSPGLAALKAAASSN